MTRRLGNLPRSETVTSFVGRRAMVGEIRTLLGSARLVTLLGPGGMGKTRLAVRVAEAAHRAFPDGVWLVELAELRDPALTDHAIIDALGVPDRSAESSEEVLIEHLQDKSLLLVIDNCEHLLDACANLIAAVLRAAPGVRIIATSREALHVPGEHVVSVPPLSFTSSEEGRADGNPLDHEAVELFVQRAAAAVPGFTLDAENREAVARLCARLEGMPLAIELAAVRLQAMGVTEILDRLEDRFQALSTVVRGAPARHQTLRAAVEWSYALCSPAEQTAWARLSVFPGGFDLDAALAVIGHGSLTAQEATDAVTGLVTKSVVLRQAHSTGARYHVLETIRQFGREILRGTDAELDVGRRHMHHFADLAARACHDWSGPRQREWSSMLRREQVNFREALRFGFDNDADRSVAVRTAVDLRHLWVMGASREGREWIDKALAALHADTPLRAQALWVAGWVRQVQGEPIGSTAILTECIDAARRLGDQVTLARAEQFLGVNMLLGDHLDHAEALLSGAQAMYRSLGVVDSESLIGLAAHGWLRLIEGDSREAERIAEECRRLSRNIGESWAATWVLWVLGLIGWTRSDEILATAALREAIEIKRELGDWLGIPCCVEVLVWMLAESGQHRRAARLMGANQELWMPIGQPMFGFVTYLEAHERYTATLREALGDAQFAAEHTAGTHLSPDATVAYALGTPRQTRTADSSPLTRREGQVARLVAEGLTNREIAEHLVISPRTAESHVENILSKLGYTSRAQIAAYVRADLSPDSRPAQSR
ncbi:LuxR C-terminal-related transcriptional regulator [Saccharopolyspora mangrovi]|uniref:LuxR C-terminal-related transcriptional regulator n=1 Tax=Saccharopolyspora mangrovi TaxID=3082379 RepID=A0ABU6AE25_9PSEU|nr:LuxR C-terminal-related transcriptional regulator [Saccharopolyspora sp. S2-29]MEB3369722.1 LuxR C-terminal-related transcriptional regulator [Saccharopolyspora sp. S2-29]